MSVKADFRLADAERTNVTMTITMTIGEWKELADALDGKVDLSSMAEPFYSLRNRIRHGVEWARKWYVVPELNTKQEGDNES